MPHRDQVCGQSGQDEQGNPLCPQNSKALSFPADPANPQWLKRFQACQKDIVPPQKPLWFQANASIHCPACLSYISTQVI
jgi:hypothetical protein